MKAQGIEGTELFPRMAERKRGSRDADILVLLWEVFKTRANEIDKLLDHSISILASSNDFPEKAEIKDALEKALVLVRT